MSVKKYWLHLFVVGSLGFVLYRVIKDDYLNMPQVRYWYWTAFSIIFLFGGFLYIGLNWKRTLYAFSYSISLRDSWISIGLTVFGKYLPGKVWLVLGRAGWISNRYGYPINEIGVISVLTQILSLWTGTLFGLIGLMILKANSIWFFLAFGLFFFLSVLLFSPAFQYLFNWVYYLFFKRKVNFPTLPIRKILFLSIDYLVTWILWAIAFHCWCQSLSNQILPASIGLGFPFASTVGIIAVFAPGGIGVREGLLVAFLVLAGEVLSDATTYAITSRVWFLAGEAIIFLFAYLLNWKKI
jgi:hypothetical protein